MKKLLIFLALLALVGLATMWPPQPMTRDRRPIPTPTPTPSCIEGVRGRLCFNWLPNEVAVIKLRWLSIDEHPTWTDWTHDATPSFGRYEDGRVCISASMDWLSYQELEWQGFDSQGRLVVSGGMPLPKGWKGPKCEPKIQWDLWVNLSPWGPMPLATRVFAPMFDLMAEASGTLWFGPACSNSFGDFYIYGNGQLMGDINEPYRIDCQVLVMQNPYMGQVREGTLVVGSGDNKFTVSYTGSVEFPSNGVLSPYELVTTRFVSHGRITAVSGAYSHLLGANFIWNSYGFTGYPIPVNGSVRIVPAKYSGVRLKTLTPTLTPTPIPRPKPMSKPSVDFKIIKQEILPKDKNKCENLPEIRVWVLDKDGNPLNNIRVEASYYPDQPPIELNSGWQAPGYDKATGAGLWTVKVTRDVPPFGDRVYTSEESRPLDTRSPSWEDLIAGGYCQDGSCIQCGNYSYEVVFQKQWS